jgi:succinate dehydrogenase/fumarate reductase flavoprotein subunit
MNFNRCPASASGDGQAIAYRAGATLTHIETLSPAVIREESLMQPGQFFMNDGIAAKVFTWTGEELPYPEGPLEYLELARKGLAPLYYSLENLPDDFQKRIEIHMADETLLRLKLGEERGFNPRTHRYQMSGNRGIYGTSGGIVINEDFKTSLKGVYAAGESADTFGYGAGGCAPMGLIIGENIRHYVNEAEEPIIDELQMERQKQTALAPLSVKDGVEPMELECAIRSICEEYSGILRSEGLLREGLRRLRSLRRVFLPKLMASNPHYLMRCLEVRNIMDMAELHFQASLARKETRGGNGIEYHQYIRLDYPEKDPLLDNKRICQTMKDGEGIIEIQEVPELKPDYIKNKDIK